VFVVALAFVATGCAPSAPAFTCTDKIGCVNIGPNDPVHIAYSMVLSGADATLGQDTKYGAEIAIDDKGSKVLGHAIKFDGQDDLCSAEGGQTAATKIAADKTALAVIGTNCSSGAVPAVPIYNSAGIVLISPSNTAVVLTDPTKRLPNYFRTAHSDKFQGAAAAQFASQELKVTKAAAVHDGSPYAQGLAQVFVDNFKKLGGTITAFEAISPDDRDMKPLLTRIAAGKPEFLYYPIFIGAGASIAAQIRDVPGLEKTIMMGADGIFSPDFLKAGGKNTIGMYHSSPDLSVMTGGYADFKAKYEKKYNTKVLAPFHAHSYDAMNIVLASVEKVAVKDPDGTLHVGRQALIDAVGATKDFKGLTGNLTCDANGDCADPHIAVYQITQANFDKLEMPSTPIWPKK
jgi:branched-chain amino acid transport system substrate-binding protein